MTINKQFFVGDPVPDFSCVSSNNPKFHFNTCAGRYIVLCFFGSAQDDKSRKAISFITNDLREYFDDQRISFFGVSIDKSDNELERVQQLVPGIRYFWDYDKNVSELYGAIAAAKGQDEETSSSIDYRPFTLVLDPNLRVIANISMLDIERHNTVLANFIASIPSIDAYAGVELSAPVLIIPRVFEPELCRQLIGLYETHGGGESGSMMEKDGYTIGKIDHSFKRRKDYNIEDKDIRAAIRARIARRIIPEIEKAFQFKVTYIERYIVACYDGNDMGFFRAHRDNTTKATAHRRFACSINLNTEEYEGGNLKFPEFGNRTYRAPTGGAVVFSCSLLHEAMPVTKGKRYATLPFFYDEEGAKIREENSHYLSNETIII